MREISSPLLGISSPFGARRNPLAAYAAAGFTPKLVPAFADEFYAKEGRKSTFGGVLEHTATTNGTMFDSDGLLKWRPHNLASNPTAPATQTITVVSGADYTVECTGVSIALSGAGTGTVTEGNPVEITAGSTSLTLTVAGSTGTLWAYRSDLGGMVNNPDTGTSFVPTTGYLPRRNHHIYNGFSWVNEGVLIEPQTRTNIFERSSPSSINYNGNSGVASPTLSQTNPFTSEGDAALITASAGSGNHYAASNVHFSTPSGASSITTTVWLERGTSRYVFFEVYGPGPDYEAACVVDLDTLSVTTLIAADVAFYVTEVANDVYALSIADNTNGNVGTPYVRVGPHDGTSSATWTASGTETVKLLAVQVEEGSSPSSFIPTYGSQVSRAGEQLVLPHESVSWPAGDELSIHIQGRMTYGDDDTSLNVVFVRWQADVNNRIQIFLNTTGSETGQVRFQQEVGGVSDVVFEATSSYSPGVNVPFNLASRHGSTFINGAVDGTALTEDTTPVAIPDLETTDLQLAYSGGSMVIKLFRMWDVNITDTGTEDATDD